MAGIITYRDQSWTAASWLFDMVLEMALKDLDDAKLVAEIQEIITSRVGLLELEDLDEPSRKVLVSQIYNVTIPYIKNIEFADPAVKADTLPHLDALERMLDIHLGH